ncbi:hypothetical protein NRA17_13130 [Acinetobacter baumannii]|nr:hypothetical protein [Acinetobacter baumannii]
MNLTNFQKKLIWGVGILVILFLWISFPYIFKLLIEAYKFPNDFKDFGPFGDIYGSLNTLISSIALCAVAYSTWLQVTSLKETREVNAKQLKIAQQSHEEQVKESRNAIFANQFYSLLNYKKDKFNSLEFEKRKSSNEKLKALAAIQTLNHMFNLYLDVDPAFYDKYEVEEIYQQFFGACEQLFIESISPLISYFYLYKNLINLINKSDLTPKEKALYIDILSNSMFQEEQLFIFWISAFLPDLKSSFDNSLLLNQLVYQEKYKNYGLRFHHKRTFRTESWYEIFDKNDQQKPA